MMTENKRFAIVTGGVSGIGKSIVSRLKEEHYRIFVIDKNKPPKEEKDEVKYFQADISDYDKIKKVFLKISDKTSKKLHLLVNNAAITGAAITDDMKSIEKIAQEDIKNLIDVNIIGTINCCKEAIPLLRKCKYENPSIIIISSVEGVRGKDDSSEIYAVTKGALFALGRSLSIKYAPANIRVNCISPGAILTNGDKEEHRYFQPLKQIGKPLDIANAVEFLASENAKFITGINLVIDGGVTAKLGYGQKKGT
ncbi:MAG: SDR family oxidoreductase [Thermoplasmatales archaeon]|nr:SDR family oxidoreductase [Thermoplasmatales archaeon]